MVNIVGKRGSGKTIKLIEYANQLCRQGHKVLIAVPVADMKNYYADRIDKNVLIITLWELLEKKFLYRNYYVLIDELEYSLQLLLKCKDLIFTSAFENIQFVSKEDWEMKE